MLDDDDDGVAIDRTRAAVQMVEDEESAAGLPDGEAVVSDKRRLVVDGVRAWVVLGATTLMSFISFGSLLALGAYFVYVEEYFGASKTQLGVLYGLFGLPFLIFTIWTAPATSLIAGTIGFRATIFFGGLLCTAGYALSSLSTEIWHLYISWGVLTMSGLSCVYSPAMGVLGFYFDRWSRTATATFMVGTGIGVVFFPRFYMLTSSVFGLHRSLLVNAALSALTCLLALLVVDPPQASRRRGSTPIDWKERLQLELVSDARFILLMLHLLFGSAFSIYIMYAVRYGEHLGLERSEATLILSLFGVGNVVGRLYNALVNCSESTAKRCWHCFRVPQSTCLVLAACCAAAFHARTEWSQMLIGVVAGVAAGLLLSSWPGLLIGCFGRERLNVMFGRALLFCGLFRIVLLPIAGWIVDRSGSFGGAYYLAAASYVVACVLLVLAERLHRTHVRRLVAAKNTTATTLLGAGDEERAMANDDEEEAQNVTVELS